MRPTCFDLFTFYHYKHDRYLKRAGAPYDKQFSRLLSTGILFKDRLEPELSTHTSIQYGKNTSEKAIAALSSFKVPVLAKVRWLKLQEGLDKASNLDKPELTRLCFDLVAADETMEAI